MLSGSNLLNNSKSNLTTGNIHLNCQKILSDSGIDSDMKAAYESSSLCSFISAPSESSSAFAVNQDVGFGIRVFISTAFDGSGRLDPNVRDSIRTQSKSEGIENADSLLIFGIADKYWDQTANYDDVFNEKEFLHRDWKDVWGPDSAIAVKETTFKAEQGSGALILTEAGQNDYEQSQFLYYFTYAKAKRDSCVIHTEGWTAQADGDVYTKYHVPLDGGGYSNQHPDFDHGKADIEKYTIEFVQKLDHALGDVCSGGNVSMKDQSAGSTSQVGSVGEGIVTGKLCYPSEVIPAGRIEAKRISDQMLFKQEYAGIGGGEDNTYSFELDEGEYYLRFVVGGIGDDATYVYSTTACPTGNEQTCGDTKQRELSKASIQAGQTFSGYDLCDYYYTDSNTPKF